MKGWADALERFWKRRGFYALTALCLLLIAAAAVFGRARLFRAPDGNAARAGAAPAAAIGTPAAQTPAPAQTATPLLWPVSGRTIKRDYAPEPVWFEPLGLYETHPGVDIGAAAGEMVVAAADGVVTRAGYDAQRGYTVETEDGGLVVRYGNLARGLEVSPGDRVRRGQTIGAVGASAPVAKALGPHLHFEAFRGGARVALP